MIGRIVQGPEKEEARNVARGDNMHPSPLAPVNLGPQTVDGRSDLSDHIVQLTNS